MAILRDSLKAALTDVKDVLKVRLVMKLQLFMKVELFTKVELVTKVPAGSAHDSSIASIVNPGPKDKTTVGTRP